MSWRRLRTSSKPRGIGCSCTPYDICSVPTGSIGYAFVISTVANVAPPSTDVTTMLVRFLAISNGTKARWTSAGGSNSGSTCTGCTPESSSAAASSPSCCRNEPTITALGAFILIIRASCC